jgi:molecular chaperone GrpE (heat shock protein)
LTTYEKNVNIMTSQETKKRTHTHNRGSKKRSKAMNSKKRERTQELLDDLINSDKKDRIQELLDDIKDIIDNLNILTQEVDDLKKRLSDAQEDLVFELDL